jgi:hypothetical protein
MNRRTIGEIALNRTQLAKVGVVGLLVALGIGSRLMVEVCPSFPPNFHAIVGTTLFAGFFLQSRALAAIVPVVSMWLSDLVLGGYEPMVMITVYASLVAPLVWRGWLRRRLSPTRVASAAIASSLFFFATTNLAVWHAWYPHTPAAFVRCYSAALPFLTYSLCGDLLFTAGLFGCYALAVRPASAGLEGNAKAGLAAAR